MCNLNAAVCFAVAFCIGQVTALTGKVCTYSVQVRYDTNCKFWGWKRCTRYRSETRSKCCDGWGPGDGNCDQPRCHCGWNCCQNGGTCVEPNKCACTSNYYSPNCEHCTLINNCLYDQYECTTASDQTCKRCEYQFGTVNAYLPKPSGGRANRICEQQCSWRPDSKQCYPGTCSGSSKTCVCANGFADVASDCMTITTLPDITYCWAKASLMEGSVEKDKVEADCHNITTDTVYTNLRINQVQVDWKTQYNGPQPTRPVYIEDFKVGVVEAKVDWSLINGGVSVARGTIDCNKGISRDNVEQSLHSCDLPAALTTAVSHGQVLKVEIKSLNGGYLKVKNYDSGSPVVDPPQYYSGQRLTHTATFTLDFEDPYHCSVSSGSNCGNMLARGPPFTKVGAFDVSWSGWTDDIAGIKEYDIEVYKMIPYGEELGYSQSLTVSDTVSNTVHRYSLTLGEAGVYTVKLTAVDNAGNTKAARRFLIFDNVYTVEISPHSTDPLIIVSAAANTTYKWITNLDKNVVTQWTGHFYNEYHKTHKFLNNIRSDHNPLDVAYETRTGQYPNTRSMEAIPNVEAVVRFDVVVQVDHEGGRTITTEPAREAFTQLTNFQTQQWSTPVERSDGDSVRVWVKAYDVVGNTVTDSVLVHVDSSPAVIEDVWLVRHGVEQLAVHHTTDLSETKLDFVTYDYHSGIHTIGWELHDMADPTRVHGDGHLPVRMESNKADCKPPTCYCIPKDNECYYSNYTIEPDFSKMPMPEGDHDFDYYFVLKVTNGAQLVKIFKYQITIDTTPPVAGVVQDGGGSVDMDYQQAFTITAMWHNFFDRESGVAFYQYKFGQQCFQTTDFSIPVANGVMQVDQTFASHDVSSTGTYYITVVAFNEALEPSLPVCSDGITIDSSPPKIHSLVIENVWTVGGLIKDGSGTVWFVDNDYHKLKVKNPESECINSARAVTVADVDPIPVKHFKYELEEKQFLESFDCKTFGALGENIFIQTENQISITWLGEDSESGIEGYHVAFGSTATSDEDIMPYKDTAGHRHYKTYHPNLHQREQFFIHVKATNKAGMENTMNVGPVIVKSTSPVFSPTLTLSLRVVDEIEYLYTHWAMADLDAMEVSRGYLQSIQFKIVDVSQGSELSGFQPLTGSSSTVPGLCEATSPPTCLAVPLSMWNIHGLHQYQVHLKVVSVSGLSGVVTSSVYTHYSGAPAAGLVMELSLSDTEEIMLSYDIDQQSNSSAVRVSWYGFHHSTEIVNYRVGLGTDKGKDDLVVFQDMGTREGNHVFTGLTLAPFQTLYSVVKATVGMQSVVVSSDGLTILPVNVALSGFTVYDGQLCSESDAPTPTQTHHDKLFVPEKCGEDVDFSTSITSYATFWNIPPDKEQYITHYKWGLQVQAPNGSWLTIIDDIDLGHQNAHKDGQVLLSGGDTYRSKVHPCHSDGCFLASYSDGITVLPDPPLIGAIISATLDAPKQTMHIEWETVVQDSDVQFSWSLTSSAGSQITAWKHVTQVIVETTFKTASFSYTFDKPLEASECLSISLRSHNPVGLYSTTSFPLVGCSVDTVEELLVIDAAGTWDDELHIVRPIELEANNHWPEADVEFTRSPHMLSAVWPSLRHGDYHWKVVSSASIERWAFHMPDSALIYESYHCSSPEVLACGKSKENFVNIRNLELVSGNRYFVCVFANETELEYEKFNQHLDAVSACSNGVTVDLVAPEAGRVWMGDHEGHIHFQNDKNHLHIYWEDFEDVETFGRTHFHTAVQTYLLDIGTTPGGVDVVSQKDVGVANMVILHDLQLQDGSAYYATITAIDHVGHQSSSTSEFLKIDISNPELTGKAMSVSVSYTDSVELLVDWTDVYRDQESGLVEYEYCVGSRYSFCDVNAVSTTAESIANIELTNILNGHQYFVTVQAINGAGLRKSSTSAGVLIDATKPVMGEVIETRSEADANDIDYQVSTSALHLRFLDVHDPHSAVVQQWLAVGSCPGCQDLMLKSPIGLISAIMLEDLALLPGTTYYSTVTACNAAGLCAVATSDGVMPDPSPPHAGRVGDGLGPEEADYLNSLTYISAHWIGTHDSESGISIVQLSAGSSPGASDLMSPQFVHGGTSAVLPLKTALTEGTKVYITLTVSNNAGVSSSTTSDGYIVDNTKPVFNGQPQLDTYHGSLKQNTQVSVSSVNVEWQVSDGISYIKEQFLSLVAEEDAVAMDTPTIRLLGPASSYTFSNVSLMDGYRYRVHVVSCDATHLCSQQYTPDILIDNSPPFTGAFAIETKHSASISRHRDAWMTYDSTPSIKLAWVGFGDPHGWIEYEVKVGTSAGENDLLKDDVSQIPHTNDDPHGDEGSVQKQTFSLNRPLNNNEEIFISIWAYNQAGLQSEVLYGHFYTVESATGSGILALERRCSSHTCAGHCVCSPHGELTCHSKTPCVDVTGQTGYAEVKLYDGVEFSTSASDVDYTHSQCMLLGRIGEISPTGKQPIMADWSIGIGDAGPGLGVFGSTQPTWRELTNLQDIAVFTIESSHINDLWLQPHTNYTFRMRIWYDDSHFGLYSSNGVRTDAIPPELSSSRKVKEMTVTSASADTDYMADEDELTIGWKDVFRDSQAEIEKYIVAIGTYPGGSDIKSVEFDGTKESVAWSVKDLKLDSGVKFFSSVTAVNMAGLSSTAHSDGFVVDSSAPSLGMVWDGLGLHDSQYTKNNTHVSVSLSGFTDEESGIDYYKWCVGTEVGKEDILPCHNIGLQLQVSAMLDNSIPSGTKVFSTIYAVNGAGLQSSSSTSDGIVIDTSPPKSATGITFGYNLLINPSFTNVLDQGWIQQGVIKNTSAGESYIILNDNAYIQQEVLTTAGDKYRVSFSIRPSPKSGTNNLIVIKIPNHHQAISILHSHFEAEDSGIWKKHEGFFTAIPGTLSSLIHLQSHGKQSSVEIKEISVQKMSTDYEVDENGANAILVRIQTHNNISSIIASWMVQDLEVPISRHLWAVGYVPGGTQIHDYEGVHTKDHARLDGLTLQQGANVYVTVITYNVVGLHTRLVSAPVTVDITPPVVGDVIVGTDQHVNYLTQDSVRLTWQAFDLESGIDTCQYAIGRGPGTYDILPWTLTDASEISLKVASLIHGDTFYAFVLCTNQAGLETLATSQIVRIVLEPPDVSNGVINIVSSSPSHFPARDRHQSSNNSLVVGCSGVHDIAGVESYSIKIRKNNDDVTNWQTFLAQGDMYVQIDELQLVSYEEYEVQLKATSKAGLSSDIISQTFFVESSTPQNLGGTPVVEWPQQWTMELDWTGLFSSPSSLIYQVNIGSRLGGVDVLQWTEVQTSKMVVSGLDHTKEHYVTISAINLAGLYTTETYVVSYQP